MANNRMYLVHKPTETAILLAKYFPTSGWYQFHTQKVMDAFFERFNPETVFGDTDFELRFEAGAGPGRELTGKEAFPWNFIRHMGETE